MMRLSEWTEARGFRMANRVLRAAALVLLVALAACAHEEAAHFKNPATGEIKSVCGPLWGMAGAIHEAHDGCVDSYKDSGWTQVTN
jgi:hypothetical protein